jgi:glutaredoxin
MKNIILYGAPFCANCQAVKRILASKDIPFTYVDIADDEQAADLLASQGFLGLPVMKENSNTYVGLKAVETANAY